VGGSVSGGSGCDVAPAGPSAIAEALLGLGLLVGRARSRRRGRG